MLGELAQQFTVEAQALTSAFAMSVGEGFDNSPAMQADPDLMPRVEMAGQSLVGITSLQNTPAAPIAANSGVAVMNPINSDMQVVHQNLANLDNLMKPNWAA